MARAILHKYSCGKASRLIKSLIQLEPIAGPDLYEIYKAEVNAQLEAA